MDTKTVKKVIFYVTFLSIVITGIIFKQPFIRMLPLLISLFIMLFQAEASRYSYIAGGLNSLLYAYVYFRLGLYATGASALFFSFPIQILTFLNWNKHAYEKSTRFKHLSGKAGVGIGTGFVLAWLAVFTVLKHTGSAYAVLDNTASLLGVTVSVLTMMAYVEYPYLWLVSSLINMILNIQVVLNDPCHIPYVIYAVYCTWCVVLAFIHVRKLYAEQQKA
ncbi:MAG: nicotinamide mononucleotide transporter [Ruminococcaceae bacterium]|nr:nicotinamide mononucleotide transporter [Oscillospiraceae bacterium]